MVNNNKQRRQLIRRKFLGITSLAGLGLTAGCVGLQESSEQTTPTERTPTPTTKPTPTPEPTKTASETPTPTAESTPTSVEIEYPPLGNFPVEDEKVVYGFNVPQSGSYAGEGLDELRGYKLAVKHLNHGGGWVDTWNELSGDGVLNKTVRAVEGDTGTDTDQARESLIRMIERDGIIMASGGSSSSVAIAQQRLCQEEKILFLCCQTNSNFTTGEDCVRYSFREMYNAHMAGQALAPVLSDEYGDDVIFYQLYGDYRWGRTMRDSIKKFMQSKGWLQANAVSTPPGIDDYSHFFANIPEDQIDVLFLDHYGWDAVTSLPQAIDSGLKANMEIVTPLYNRILAKEASDYIADVHGTVDWSWQLEDKHSERFTQSFRDEFGKVPPYVSRLAYLNVLAYSAAVERAGTFYPPEVIKELEGWNYGQAGLGQEKMRKCDHQAQRDIIVVRGLSKREQTDQKLLEVVQRTDKAELGYSCSSEMARDCTLGPYT